MLTFNTILFSANGARPVQTANLHSSPSTCSVIPTSAVYGKKGERKIIYKYPQLILIINKQ